MSGKGVILYPGGILDAGSRPANSLFRSAERIVLECLEEARCDIVVCLGIDGSVREDGIARDQIAVAVSQHGIIAAGRKFFPTDWEEPELHAARDHLVGEEGKPRVFEFCGVRYYLAVCYDTYGIRKRGLENPGVDAILNAVHGFYPKGTGGSGEVYFAKYGFAGASKQWGCPVYASAFFFGRAVPPRWPTAVLWNKHESAVQKWKYSDNPLRRQRVAALSIGDVEVVCSIYDVSSQHFSRVAP